MSNNIYDELLSRLTAGRKVRIQSTVTVEAVRKGIFRAMGKVEKEMMGMVTYPRTALKTEVISAEDGSSIIEIYMEHGEKPATITIIEDGEENEAAGGAEL